MKVTLDLKDKFKKVSFLVIVLIVLTHQTDVQLVQALSMKNYDSEIITEELRLRVPSEFKEVWLNAEKKTWEPWLSIQDGFLGRQIFWDKEKEEALILVNWKNKKLWKNISINEVTKVQDKFEDDVKTALNISENPFKLIYEGELYKEG